MCGSRGGGGQGLMCGSRGGGGQGPPPPLDPHIRLFYLILLDAVCLLCTSPGSEWMDLLKFLVCKYIVVYLLLCLCSYVTCVDSDRPCSLLLSLEPPNGVQSVPKGAQWLSGRVLDSRPRGCGFEPHRCLCIVVLEQDTFILA